MSKLFVLMIGVFVLIVPLASYALDHKNLDEGRPTRLEDPYAIANGELAIEAGVGGDFSRRQATDRAVFPIQILYGAFANFHAGIGSTILTSPRDNPGFTKSGDLEAFALYNFNQETLGIPAFGLEVGANIPTGIDSSGVDVEIKGLIAKSIGRLGLHLNASHVFATGTKASDKNDQHRLVLGSTYPLGAPRYTRLTAIVDAFVAGSTAKNISATYGAELGFRYQLTPRTVFDAGLGSEFSGPAGRAPFFVRTGLSFGY